jgi:hypothetical protein
MSRHRKILWDVPKSLPTWVMSYEVWRGNVPYRAGTLRIPAETEQAAREAVETVLRDLMPNLFPDSEIRLTSALVCEAR